MLILIKHIFSVLLYILLLPISTPAAFIVSTWTRPDDTNWGGWFRTYDNPPQGDRKWLRDHPDITGWRGYLNRVGWIRRNRLYGLKRWLAVDYTECTTRKFRGNPSISDKYKVPGWLFVTARCHNKKNCGPLSGIASHHIQRTVVFAYV